MTAHSATRAPSASEARGTLLGKEISDFLIEFSIGVHRYSMYPPGHPSLTPAAGNVLDRLQSMLRKRAQVSLGVARRQLIIDGVATTDRNPVLTELAKRLHAHQVGAITFGADVTLDGIEGLLRTLAVETEREGEPIGLRPVDEIPKWPDIRLVPVGYEDLELARAEGDEDLEAHNAMELWLGLARAATAELKEAEEEDVSEPRAIAAEINRHAREKAYDQVIVGYLLQLAEELSDDGTGGGSGSVRGRVSKLIAALDNPTLKRILEMGGDVEQRSRFVRHATKGMDTAAALRILTAASEASGQEISIQMVRMLGKLSRHAQMGNPAARPVATKQFTEKVEDLLRDWNLESPNPEGYVRILDELAKTSPLFLPEDDGMEIRFGLSLVKMALEVDAYGPMVEVAMDELLTDGQLPEVIPLVEGAQVTMAGRKIRERISSPEQIENLSKLEDVDPTSLGLLVEMVGAEASIVPLLTALTEAGSRSIRRMVFDCLVQIGDPVADLIGPFMEDERWYVSRNMLSLVGALPRLPKEFTSERFVTHGDSRVRREAIPIALGEPDLRVKALVHGLRDEDDRVVRLALVDLAEGVPDPVIPILVDRVVRAQGWPTDLSVLGIRALGQSRSPQARLALQQLVTSGRSLFGRPKIRAASDTMLAALTALRGSWHEHPDVQPLIRAAAKSRNIAISRVASREGA